MNTRNLLCLNSNFLLYWEKLWLFWKPNNFAEHITYDCNTESVIVKFALSICVVQRIDASSRPEYFLCVNVYYVNWDLLD